MKFDKDLLPAQFREMAPETGRNFNGNIIAKLFQPSLNLRKKQDILTDPKRLLQLFDPVADLGRDFKVELGGRDLHLVFQ